MKIYDQINKLFLKLTVLYSKNKSNGDYNYKSNQYKGQELEQECMEILNENGWQSELTPISNDQGADVIAKKGLIKLVLQCKNLEKPAGNDSVQQAISAKSFFSANLCAVISPSGFTNSAKLLAEKTDVILMSVSDLKEI